VSLKYITPPQGTLYIVSTPIGNLGDITFRAIDTLKEANLIACEDTRITGRLTNHYGIRTPMTSYNDHNGERKRPRLLERLQKGEKIALVSDAGTPLVSDPGFKLVQTCIEESIQIVPIPGASAILSAIVASGIPTDKFMFVGFLPTKEKKIVEALNKLRYLESTLIIFETAKRLKKTSRLLAEQLGPRKITIAREITKHYEEFSRMSIKEAVVKYEGGLPPKGEIVIIVGPPSDESELNEFDIDNILKSSLETLSVKDAANAIAPITNKSRRELYERAVELLIEIKKDN
jgi:16S rRNA (cytidine1402-2'-O)-methyltransferase